MLSFREIRPVVSALMHVEKLADGQTDCGAERETAGRRDMTKLIGPLCDYKGQGTHASHFITFFFF